MTASIWSPGTTSTPTLPAVAPVQFLPGTAALPGITFVGDTNTGIWSQSDGWLNFAVNGITRLSIDPLGNVIYNGKISTAPEVTIASSTVTDIGSVGSNSVLITGTNAITSFGTTFAGPMFVRFAGSLTLANSAVLILPGAVNIAVASGDALIAVPKATAGVSDGWYVVGFQRATTGSSSNDYLNTTRIDVTAAATLDLNTNAPNTRNINIVGTTAITGVTITVGSLYFVRFNAALTLTNNASIVTQTGANITTAAGDTCILRATAANTVEILSYVAAIPTQIAVRVPQTVLSGPVDSNGFSAFGGSTGSTTVTAVGTLVATAANSLTNRIGTIVNPSWTGLTASAYLYLDIASDGTCTTGSTTLLPTYRWGGADVITSGQFTFNVQEMTGKVGNGSTAAQTYRVFVGEVVASGTVSAITWYQLNGKYYNEQTTFAASTVYSFNSNIGTVLQRAIPWMECKTTDIGYAVGDRVYMIGGDLNGTAYGGTQLWTTKNTCGFTVGAGGLQLPNKSTGVIAGITNANWKIGFEIMRGF